MKKIYNFLARHWGSRETAPRDIRVAKKSPPFDGLFVIERWRLLAIDSICSGMSALNRLILLSKGTVLLPLPAGFTASAQYENAGQFNEIINTTAVSTAFLSLA